MENNIDFSKLTFSIIKPDAVVEKKSGLIIDFLEKHGFKIILQRKCHISLSEAQAFYIEHAQRPFYNDLCNFLSSGPAIVQVLMLDNGDVIKKYREVMGDTNPNNAADNTIRKLFGRSIDYNAVHGSDSVASSEKEILYFFNKNELLNGIKSNLIQSNQIFLR